MATATRVAVAALEPSKRRQNAQEIVLFAPNISVLDRASVSLWHFQQLLAQQSAGRDGLPLEELELDDQVHIAAVRVEDHHQALLPEQMKAQQTSPQSQHQQALALEVDHDGSEQPDGSEEPDDEESHRDQEDDPDDDPDEQENAEEVTAHQDAEEQEEGESAAEAAGSEEVEAGRLMAEAFQLELTDSFRNDLEEKQQRAPLELSDCQMTLHSRVSVVYERYRCIICLDASPSTLSIDPDTGRLFLDLLFDSMELLVHDLAQHMLLGKTAYEPRIHLSVIIQGAFVESMCVLIQGFVLTGDNTDKLLDLVRERFHLIEDEWARVAQDEEDGGLMVQEHSIRTTLSLLIQNAMFALNSLPIEAAPLIFILTDGVVDFSDSFVYDNLLMQLSRHDVQVHFIRIGSGNESYGSLGFVPDVDLLRYVADCCGGRLFDHAMLQELPEQCNRRNSWQEQPSSSVVYPNLSTQKLSLLQEAAFVRGSSIHAISLPFVRVEALGYAFLDSRTMLPLRPYRLWREKVHEYRIFAEVDRIVEARIREGFTVMKLHFERIVEKNTEIPSKPTASSVENGKSSPAKSFKTQLIFVLQWKQNVWLEYVAECSGKRPKADRSDVSHRRPSSFGTNSRGRSFNAQSSDERSREWHIRMNIVAHAEFLRAFEDTLKNAPSALNLRETPGSPSTFHDFVKNVQDVDRVLLHLIIASAESSSRVESSSPYALGSAPFGGISSNSGLNSMRGSPTHPVFTIIGELSPVLWHRWFHVERFELLSILRNEVFSESFYQQHGTQTSNQNILAPAMRPVHFANPIRTSLHIHREDSTPIGVDKITEHLLATLTRWSSQKLTKDLFLHFLSSEKPNEIQTPKESPSPMDSNSFKRRQRSSPTTASSKATSIVTARSQESPPSLCFVRVDVRSKTLVAIHVAFFATKASVRKRTVAELKARIATEFCSLSPKSSSSSSSASHFMRSSTQPQRSVVLCHRLVSRLLVTRGVLQFFAHECGDHASQLKPATFRSVASCCGGSELARQNVFGAYMWHSSWKWKLSNRDSLVAAMKYIHEARINSGFWVLDWSVKSTEEHSSHLESVIFGREVMMQDESGQLKASLLQYAMLRVSDTELLTSFWMEPQHGLVNTKLAVPLPSDDSFLWELLYAVGHSSPLGRMGGPSRVETTTISTSDLEETRSMEQEDSRAHEIHVQAMYLEESDLLRVIRDCLFESDRHMLSCLYTLDCIMNLRESIELLTQLSKGLEGVVGSTWNAPLQREAPNHVIVPPFSTARLLGISKRTTEHFLMYLDVETKQNHALSQANEHLYSMLERTLKGLTDCEVFWTDQDGHAIGGDSRKESTHGRKQRCRLHEHLPLWLAKSISKQFHKASSGAPKLSKGRCFAKLLSNSSVVLVFLPAMDMLQVKYKSSSERQISDATRPYARPSTPPLTESSAYPTMMKVSDDMRLSATKMMRVAVSADDIVLYQERRLSFREGYKSWRMGHFQGAKDEKKSLVVDRNYPSTLEDHEFCEQIARQFAYGCDYHLVIQRQSASASAGLMGSGFFQIAFYECSLESLALDGGRSAHGDFDISGILEQVFVTSPAPTRDKRDTNTEGTPSASQVIRSLQKKIKRAHEDNFSRGVYVALRDGGNVQHIDLLQALSSCVEVPMDLDITLLYRMILASNALEDEGTALRGAFADGSLAFLIRQKLDKSFEKIFGELFLPIGGTKYYYFTGNEASFHDDFADEGAYDLHFLMEEESLESSSTLEQEFDSVRNSDSSRVSVSYENEKMPSEKNNSEEDLKSQDSSSHSKDTPHLDFAAADSVEEDAELNKEVAVATSSFSAPFFFRFECKEIARTKDPTVDGLGPLASMSSMPKSSPAMHRSMSSMTIRDLETAELSFKRAAALSAGSSSLAKNSHALGDVIWEGKELASQESQETVTQVVESFDKIASSRVALRLVTLTLPNEQLIQRSRQQSAVPLPSEAGPSVAQAFAALPLFQRQVLKKLRNQIKEWCNVEILSILKSNNEITPSIGRLVQKLFEELPSEFLTRMRFPLQFVTTPQDQSMSPLNLLKETIRRAISLCTIQCNGAFFVVSKDPETKSGIRIPYWAMIEVEKDHLILSLHHPDRLSTSSKDFDRLRILTELQLGIQRMCRHVNQYLLLLQLHETRSCSVLLLPKDPPLAGAELTNSPKDKREISTSMDAQDSSSMFTWPGQFECDLKYSALFRLHERLSPNVAMNVLSTSALEQFQVHNRRHMFVYRDRGGHVFYIRIHISTDKATTESTRHERRRFIRATSGQTGTAASGVSANAAGVLLQVYGVCEPGDEVTHELYRLLERKLDEAALLILMKLLARNVKFQLSPSDISFICPSLTKPTAKASLELPRMSHDWSSLLVFFGQTLCLAPFVRQINALGNHHGSSEQDPNVGEGKASSTHNERNDPTVNHPALFGQTRSVRDDAEWKPEALSPIFFTSSTEDEVPPSVEEIVEEATFIMNINPELRLTSGFLSRVGKGLAILKIELVRMSPRNFDAFGPKDVDDEGFSFAPETTGPFIEEINSALRLAENDPSEPQPKTHMVLRFHLWIRGSINTMELGRVLESCIKQTLYDHAMECLLRKCHELSSENVKSVKNDGNDSLEMLVPSAKSSIPHAEISEMERLMQQSYAIDSSSMVRIVFGSIIPSWDIENVIQQIQQYLNTLPSHLQPETFEVDEHHGLVPCELIDGDGPPSKSRRAQFKIICCLRQQAIVAAYDLSGSLSSGMVKSSSRENMPQIGEGLSPSQSVQSDLSELENPTSRNSFMSNSGDPEPPFRNQRIHGRASTTSSTGSAGFLAFPTKEFTENEAVLYPSVVTASTTTTGASADECSGSHADSTTPVKTSRRSMWYVIKLSVAGGIELYGYNMSTALVDNLMIGFARAITWSKMRENLLRSLLLSKSGLLYAAPLGSQVIQPRLLGHLCENVLGKLSTALPKDFCVNFIEFNRLCAEILQENGSQPRILDASTLRMVEKTTLGKYLRDAGQNTSENNAESNRGRAKSTVNSSALPPDLLRETSSKSLRGGLHNDNSSTRGSSTQLNAQDSFDQSSIPSPTRRTAQASGGFNSGGGGGSMNFSASKLRGGTGAANALLAARARARGGSGLPGFGGGKSIRFGGPSGPMGPSGQSHGGDRRFTGSSKSGNEKDPSSNVRRFPSNDSISAMSSRSAKSTSNNSLRDFFSPLQSPAATSHPHHRSNRMVANWKTDLIAFSPRFPYEWSYDTNGNLLVSRDEAPRNPVAYFTGAFRKRIDHSENVSSGYSAGLSVFQRLVGCCRTRTQPNEELSREVVEAIERTGRSLLNRRIRVSYLEKMDLMDVESGMEKETNLTVVQASMDLINLLSYEREFIFIGVDAVIANLYVEYTVECMGGQPGVEMTEMKRRMIKNVPDVKMKVAMEFAEKYSSHLTLMGFYRLCLVRDCQDPSLERHQSGGSSSSRRINVSEYFVYSKPLKWLDDKSLLMVHLLCDHHGIRLSASIIHQSDLEKQALGFQSTAWLGNSLVKEEKLVETMRWIERSLDLTSIVQQFAIQQFYDHLFHSIVASSTTLKATQNVVKGIRSFLETFPTNLTADGCVDPCNAAMSSSASASVRSMANAWNYIRTSCVKLPTRIFDANFSFDTQLKILMRYIACHAFRYDVCDLMRSGTPDTVVCHSSHGNFFHRPKKDKLGSLASGGSHSHCSGGLSNSKFKLNKCLEGYCLLITAQSIELHAASSSALTPKPASVPKSSPKANPSQDSSQEFSIQIILIKCHQVQRTRSSDNMLLSRSSDALRGVDRALVDATYKGILPMDRALEEAKLFTRELFGVAMGHYERDILWSRLLYGTSPVANDVASSLELSFDHLRAEVGADQLEKCLSLSVCTNLKEIDPSLEEMLTMQQVNWLEFPLRLGDLYHDSLREYQFGDECHLLLLCPDARDIMIHLSFDRQGESQPSPHQTMCHYRSQSGSSSESAKPLLHMEICRREEPKNHQFTIEQRQVIGRFVNSIVHWLWRNLLYD